MKTWKTGDAVRITHREKTASGAVLLASKDGRSIMLQFEGMLGPFVGAMPVLQDDDGSFRALFVHEKITLEEEPRTK